MAVGGGDDVLEGGEALEEGFVGVGGEDGGGVGVCWGVQACY